MSQCLNEQPGELLLKSPLKKEGKKEKVYLLGSKKIQK